MNEKAFKSWLSNGLSDAKDMSLAEHDRRWHPSGYKEGDKCLFRENRSKGDKADEFGTEARGEKPLKARDIDGEHRVVRMCDVLRGKSREEVDEFLRSNRDSYVRMYHGTGSPEVLNGGALARTNRKNRRTAQSSSGFVYLSSNPETARRYAKMGYNGPTKVFSVDIKASELKPDRDSLYFRRREGSDGAGIGESLADSLYYTGNARVARDIMPYEMGVVDLSGEEVDDSAAPRRKSGLRAIAADAIAEAAKKGVSQCS